MVILADGVGVGVGAGVGVGMGVELLAPAAAPDEQREKQAREEREGQRSANHGWTLSLAGRGMAAPMAPGPSKISKVGAVPFMMMSTPGVTCPAWTLM